jgi:hypothetical protein
MSPLTAQWTVTLSPAPSATMPAMTRSHFKEKAMTTMTIEDEAEYIAAIGGGSLPAV